MTYLPIQKTPERHLFLFCDSERCPEIFPTRNNKVLGKPRIETAGSLVIDKIIALGSKAFAFTHNDGNQ